MRIRNLLVGSVLFASLTVLSANFPLAATQTFIGVVTDNMCGKKHTMMPGNPDSECVRACVNAGSKYALLVGDKVYTMSGDEKSFAALAGRKAKATGELKGDTVAVTSILAGK